jgi:hypothetical protein
MAFEIYFIFIGIIILKTGSLCKNCLFYHYIIFNVKKENQQFTFVHSFPFTFYIRSPFLRSPKDFWPIHLCVFIDFGLEKIKKYLEAPKLKMAAQFKLAAKI